MEQFYNVSSSNTTNLSPIAIFDSGVGGLSLLKEIVELLPDERFLYIADTARLPYGSRSREEVAAFTCQMLYLAVDMGAKLILNACNTSTASLPKEIYDNFPLPVLNIISPIADIVKTFGKVIAVIATPLTIASGIYQNTLREHVSGIDVIGIPCEMLASIVEDEVIPIYDTQKFILFYLEPFLGAEIDTLIYGCSHYTFLDKEIKNVVQGKINIVDPARQFAIYVQRYVNENGFSYNNDVIRVIHENNHTYQFLVSQNTIKKDVQKQYLNTCFFSTGNPTTFASNVLRLIGFRPNVEQIFLGE